MRLIRARLYADGGARVFTPEEQISVLAALVPLEDVPRTVFNTEGKSEYWYGNSQLWDLDVFPIDLISTLDDIKHVPLPQKLAAVFEPRAQTVYNEHVKVVMPGIGLLRFDHVTVVYDCCTDELRSYLKLGWRIIAVCPQPDQRRPDYVLGRVGPEE